MNYETENKKLFQEGMIDDSLKNTAKAIADVDIDEISKGWDNPDDPVSNKSKMNDINTKGIEKARDSLGSIDKTLGRYRVDTRSIIARARNSVLQFPIYVTQTLRVNEAQIISKLFERVYTTLVQTVLSHNQILDEEEANDLVFLKRFHTNLKEAADVLTNQYYKPIDELDQMMYESIFYTQKLTENCTVSFSVVPCTDKDLILENTRLMNEPLTGFIYLRESDTKTSKGSSGYVSLNDNDLEDMAADRSKISAAEKRLTRTSAKEIEDGDKDKAAEARKKLDAAVDEIKEDIKANKIKGCEYKNGRYVRVEQRNETSTTTETKNNRAVDAPVILKEADIKKINGMLPYTIEASFRIRTRDGFDRDIKYIIGIKSVMHLIRSQDLADDLQELVTGNIKSLQKVRYKTGEINFADYMFNIKGMKADAAKHINYNKRWINTLKRLADYKKLNGSVLKKPVEAINRGDVPIPNGTLILAQPDVTMLTNQTGIDLSKVGNAKRLARSLYLISIVIVDSSAGTMRVLFPDSDNDWDVQSLAAIDAELSKTENSQLMKELSRMVK